MKKKGFTLIELLAVIIILSIIALITVPVIMNVIEKARIKIAEDSIYGYVRAIENKTSLDDMKGIYYEDKENYSYDEIEVDTKGSKPIGGSYTLEDGEVTKGTFCINGYTINYQNRQAKVKKRGCEENNIKQQGSIKLSSNSGNYKYPSSGTFEVIENISNGELSCKSSDESIETCSISGTTVTVTPKNKVGSAILTIKSKETSSYTEATASHVVITADSLLSVTANGFTGVYDGSSHGITVVSEGATIKYGETDGTYNLDNSPTYSDAGTYIVYYQVTKEGYKTVTGNKTVVISKAEGNVSISTTSGEVEKGKSITFTIGEATGNLSCTSSDENIATCSISGTTVTVNGLVPGNSVITINVAASTNYNATNIAYSIIVKETSILTSTNNCINSGTCSKGTLVNVQVNDTEKYSFYVIDDDGKELTLIMNKNLGDTVAWISKSDYEAAGGTKFGNTGNNSKGPLTALKELKTRTDGWTNIKAYDYILEDDYVVKYQPIEITNVRARMLTLTEATNLGCKNNPNKNSCPSWLYENLSVENTLEKPTAYWLSTANTSPTDLAVGISWYGYSTNYGVQNTGYYGIRPVIKVSKN